MVSWNRRLYGETLIVLVLLAVGLLFITRDSRLADLVESAISGDRKLLRLKRPFYICAYNYAHVSWSAKRKDTSKFAIHWIRLHPMWCSLPQPWPRFSAPRHSCFGGRTTRRPSRKAMSLNSKRDFPVPTALNETAHNEALGKQCSPNLQFTILYNCRSFAGG